MKTYSFHIYTIMIVLAWVIIWMIQLFFIMWLLFERYGIFYQEEALWIFAIIEIVILYLGLRFLRKSAQITLFDNYFKYKIDSQLQTIYFKDISKYKYSLGRNTNLTLYFSDIEWTTIRSNDLFCSNEELEEFCVAFENQIEKVHESPTAETIDDKEVESFKTQYSANNCNSKYSILSKFEKNDDVKKEQTSNNIKTETKKPKKIKSFFEKKWAYPTLIVMTVLAIFVIISIISSGGDITGVLLVGISSISAIWATYYKHNKK